MHHEHGNDERDPITGQPWGAEERIETKEFFRTSEFGVLVIVSVGVVLAAAVAVAVDALAAAQLITFLAFGYILSRGLAKSGTAHPYAGRRRLDLRERFSERSQGYAPYPPQQQPYPQQPQYAPPPQPTEPVPAPPRAADPGYGPDGSIRQPTPAEQHPARGTREAPPQH